MNTGKFRLTIGILGLLLVVLSVFLILQSPAFREVPPATDTVTEVASTPLVPTATPENAAEHAFEDVQLAWFYKPPEKESLPILAENYDIFVLTHKDEGQRDTLKSMGETTPIHV